MAPVAHASVYDEAYYSSVNDLALAGVTGSGGRSVGVCGWKVRLEKTSKHSSRACTSLGERLSKHSLRRGMRLQLLLPLFVLCWILCGVFPRFTAVYCEGRIWHTPRAEVMQRAGQEGGRRGYDRLGKGGTMKNEWLGLQLRAALGGCYCFSSGSGKEGWGFSDLSAAKANIVRGRGRRATAKKTQLNRSQRNGQGGRTALKRGNIVRGGGDCGWGSIALALARIERGGGRQRGGGGRD